MNPTTHRTRSSNRRLLLFFVVLAGAVGGAAGLFGGGLIAAATCDWNVKEAGCLEDAAYGAVIGGSILIPVGVVVGSWRRASFPTFLCAFLAVGRLRHRAGVDIHGHTRRAADRFGRDYLVEAGESYEHKALKA